VLEQARLAAATTVPVLFLGEPGTGKEWLARSVHYESDRKDGAFVALDCRRTPTSVLYEILFGNEPGAVRPRNRTVFLREPAALPRDFQMLLCRTLADAGEHGRDRMMAAATTEPARDIASGRLLEEFHCALSPLTISLPPLRERRKDLPEFVEQMLERAAAATERRVTGLTPAAWDLVNSYNWPGNLHELYLTLRTACFRANDQIDVSDFPETLRLAVRMDKSSPPPPEPVIALDRVLEEAERRLIVLALKRAKGNKSRAAELLSIWRSRLLRRMEALGITGFDDE